MTSQPETRATARVLPVDDQGRVLVLVIETADGDPALMSIGGGVEPGESEREAAVRELAEETGLVADPDDLVGPVWRSGSGWASADGTPNPARPTFFALPLDRRPDVSQSGLQPDERTYVTGYEWATPAELAVDPRVRIPILPTVASLAVAAVSARGPQPVHRTSARVLPVSPEGEVLLIQELDPARPGVRRWGTVGGATDGDETLEAAAVRELFEETGIRCEPAELTRVHHFGGEFSWGGVRYLGDNTCFALAADREVEITLDHLEPEEVATVTDVRWWTPGAVAHEVCVPDHLPEIMAAAVSALAAR